MSLIIALYTCGFIFFPANCMVFIKWTLTTQNDLDPRSLLLVSSRNCSKPRPYRLLLTNNIWTTFRGFT